MEAVISPFIGNLQMELLFQFNNTHQCQKDLDLTELYTKCIQEEFKELMEEKAGTPENMKELCDLIWVCIQYANACGYNLEDGMKELLKEYKSKFYDAHGNYNPTYRSDGKLLKGAGFKKANFGKFFE